MSALFSGLTLGLMSLDPTGLEIVMEGDDPELSRAARKIYPVRKNGNRLLCTLLLGNVAVNALLSILMADVAGGLAGFLVSTAVIVIFGEILPQAACSRYALQIGSRAIPLIKVIICLFLPVSAPLGWALDKMLGHELGTTYSKAEMTKLLEIHVKEGRFNEETGTASKYGSPYRSDQAYILVYLFTCRVLICCQ
jgi:metal transporter CNNM